MRLSKIMNWSAWPFFGKRYISYQDYRNRILAQALPSIKINFPRASKDVFSFLMLCHDQHIDRRIILQARELYAQGWSGIIIALSHNDLDQIDSVDGVLTHRIGLSKIIPNCPVYWRYQNISRKIAIFNQLRKPLHKLNWIWYKFQLKRIYKSKSVADPLPFDECFFQAARQYPANLIFAHDLPALKAACQVAEEWNVPVLYDSHELYSEQAAFSDHQRNILDERERQYAPRCAQITTVSRSFAEVIAQKNHVKLPEVILNSYADYTPPPQRTTFLSDALTLPPGDRVVLYQGGISHHRNLPNLVTGFLLANLANVHLVFLGPSMPVVLAELRKRAGKEVGRHIHFLEPVPQDVLLDWTTSADFGVIPYPPVDLNTRYCMPNKLFEYIQAELPVLANDLHEVGRIMGELGGGGLTRDLNTPEGMAAGLQSMLTRDLEADRRILADAKHRFSWSNERIQFLRIVNGIMNRTRTGVVDGS